MTNHENIQGVTNVDENAEKALNRMNFKSVSNMLQKFSANDFMKSHNCSLK